MILRPVIGEGRGLLRLYPEGRRRERKKFSVFENGQSNGIAKDLDPKVALRNARIHEQSFCPSAGAKLLDGDLRL